MSLRQLVKKAFELAGLQVYARRTLPWGLNLQTDLRRLLPSAGGLVIFDVGANVGQTLQRLAPLSKPGHFYSFEPIAATFEILRRNSARHNGVKTFQLALGNEDGEVWMELRGSSEWHRIWVGGNSDDVVTEKVKVSKLDSFCEKQGVERIDLLKTDCEGHDLEVLKGAERMLSQGRIQAVFTEVNFLRNNSHGDFFKIHDHLAGRGFYFFAFYDYAGWGRNFSECVYCNALWLKR